MYLSIVNYSERGPSGHQLILRQPSLCCGTLRTFTFQP